MSTSYIQAVNEILAETNEVELTSAGFSSAVGIQSFVKSIINRSYLEICAYKKRWPFLAAASGNVYDPYAGNVFVTTEAGTRWYLLNDAATNIQEDFREVAWEDFFLTDEGLTGAQEPPLVENLCNTSFKDWKDIYRERETQDAFGEESYGVPRRVIRSVDGRYFGLSPIPDKAYKVYFAAWVRPQRLVSPTDKLLFPDEYTPVLYDKARYYVHQFKENEVQANLARADYRRGINFMVQDLIGEKVKDFGDDRIRF